LEGKNCRFVFELRDCRGYLCCFYRQQENIFYTSIAGTFGNIEFDNLK